MDMVRMDRRLAALLVGSCGLAGFVAAAQADDPAARRDRAAFELRVRPTADAWAGPRPWAAAPAPFTTALATTGADPLAHVPLHPDRSEKIADDAEVARAPASPPPAPGSKPERVEVAPPPPPVEAAETVDAPAPEYPRTSRRKREQGTVTLLAEVRSDGTVASCKVETSSGFPLLDQAALAVLPEWRFKPRLVAGTARPFTARVPFRFSLQ
jgi:protein TonB